MAHAGRRESSGSQLRIKAFPQAPDQSAVNRTWEQLRCAIIEIQNKNNSGLSFEELYRSTYTLIIHKYGDRLYNNVRGVVEEHVLRVRSDVLARLNDDFLNVLQVAWKDHQNAMVMIRDILMYMNRVYVTQNQLPSIYTVGMQIFQNTVLEYGQIKSLFLDSLFDMIKRERNGEAVNRIQIRDACQMLIAIGEDSKDFYRRYFQTPLMELTRLYYSAEAQSMLAENVSTPIFIKRVEKRIEDEIKRVKLYLDPSTEPEMMALLEEELITKILQSVIDIPDSGLTHMLKTDKISEICSLYKLIKSVKTGPSALNEVLCSYFITTGRKIVEDSGASDAQQYIQDLMALRGKADEILTQALENHSLFRNKLNTTFEEFINGNSRSPEFLSLFIDAKLKKGNRGVSDQEIDGIFDKCIVIFRYLCDKDIFEGYYKQHLAKRLLLSKSQSDDLEKSMISKLMVECGAMFTNKFEGMFKDMTLSKNLDSDFNKYPGRAELPFDINVRVLTAGLWPTERENQSIQLPEEASKAFAVFETFYLNKYTGRKITLQCNQGNAELHSTFYGKAAMKEITGGAAAASTAEEGVGSAPGGPGYDDPAGGSSSTPPQSTSSAKKKFKSYDIQVSTYQMVILMKFNKRPKYTFDELLTETSINERELTRALMALALGKSSQRILVKEPKSKKIEPSDTFFVNDGFVSEHFKVKVQNITMKETEPERQETRQTVDDNRKYVIEATIVRIMKTRKQLNHNSLLTEVIEQLTQRFHPSPQMIKSRIECLLERGYLARSDEDRRVYKYLA